MLFLLGSVQRNEGRFLKTEVEKSCKDYSEGCSQPIALLWRVFGAAPFSFSNQVMPEYAKCQ